MQHLNETEKMPQRVVILGAGGVIGKSLARILEKKNVPTLALTRKNIDLTQEGCTQKLLSLINPTDSIVFLAAITPDKGKGVGAFFKNIQMAKNFCGVLEKTTPKHIIYLSSDAVYSLQQKMISEKSLADPEDLYGIMHLSREHMIKASTSSSIAILRSALIYSPEDTHNSYGPNRIRRSAQKQGKIALFGNGEEQRDHVFVEDVSSLIFHTLCYQSRGILNLATGQSISYMDLSKKVVSLFNKQIEIECSTRKNPVTHRHFDITLIRRTFPFFQFHSLDEGLKKTHAQEFSQNV